MKEKKKYKLGFIGLGHMGLAIAKGAVLSEAVERYQICAYDPGEKAESVCKLESFTLLTSEQEVVQQAEYVFLAITPKQLPSVLKAIQQTEPGCLVTIVAGVPMHKYTDVLGQVPLIRAMPNAPLQVGEGAVALCKNDCCCADDYDFIYNLFNVMGVTRSIPEDKMCEIIAVNGSTPAYFYYFLECMQEDLKQCGVPEEDVRALLVQTMLGTAKLIQAHPEKTFDQFLEEICTPSGTSIAAVDVLKEKQLSAILQEANRRCIERAEELGK